MATPNLIVGLGHRKRVGKDTFAGFLEDALVERGYVVYKFAFAHDMKEMAQEIFGTYGLRGAYHYEVNPNHREQPLDKIGKTPRQIWIEFGNAMRKIHPDIWVERVHDLIKNCLLHIMLKRDKPAAFILTDVRYPNEAEAIKSWGGHLIKIERPEIPHSDDVADRALEEYTGWEWRIANDDGLTWLAAQAKTCALYLHNTSIGKPWIG